MYLDDKRCQKQDQQKDQKRKALMDEVTEMKVKKKRIEEDVRVLMKSADSNAEKAESESKLYLISKSNRLRRSAKEKEKNIKADFNLTEKMKELHIYFALGDTLCCFMHFPQFFSQQNVIKHKVRIS